MSSSKRQYQEIIENEVEEVELATDDRCQTRSRFKSKSSFINSKRARRSATEEINAFPNNMIVEEDIYENDEEFAEELERALLVRKRNIGFTAEAAVIESIELVHFMCHKFLKVSFGPKINFIIGHNGSGKSAILTGITVCLGGKANVTNRASNLKSLIREGANVAQITLKLRNHGEDAYHREIYGDSIIIERRISRDGSNGYKLKTQDGKTVSTKREDLNSILDHMAIQVDNPLNVLSQDTARQFLHSSSPEDKYKFFMKGTHLAQLSQDYEFIREQLVTTTNIVKYKREILPDLLKKAKEAEARFKDMQKARELEKSLTSLKDQMAWAQVEEQEQVVNDAERNLQRAMKRLPNLQEKLEKEEADFEEINTIVLDLEQKYHSLTNISINPLKERKKELSAHIRDKTKQLNELKNEEREINNSIKSLKQDVERHQQKIIEETSKLKDDNRQKRNEITNAIKVSEQQHDTLIEGQKQCKSQLTELEEKIEHIQNQRSSWERQLQRCQEEIMRFEDLLQQELRWHRKPVGPFGLYIKLLKPEWSETLESVIGNTLSTFAVNNHNDQRLLADIMKRYKCNSPIIVGEDDRFDYTVGEPDERFLTILRALRIENENVKRRLINSNRIESIILVESRAEADKIMYNNGKGFPRNVEGCYTIDGYKVGHKGGGFSTQSINKYRGPARFNQDVDLQIRDTEKKLSDTNETCNRYKAELERAKFELTKVNEEKRILQCKLQDDHRAEKELYNQILQLKEDLQQDEPANIAALEEVIRETEQEIDMYKGQYTNIQRKKLKITQEHDPLVNEMEDIQQRLDSLSNEAESLGANIEEKVRIRVKSDVNKKHWENKLASEKEKIASISSDVENKKRILEDWTSKAISYCPRVEVMRPAHELDREIKEITIRLSEREKECGASLEEVSLSLAAAQDAYRNARNEMMLMDRFTQDLKMALKGRMFKWIKFRTYIAVRARILFLEHLSKRGYSGKLDFDHQSYKLAPRVQIDDQQGQNSDKDPKSLSGGEKSFSTLCLLLALWDAMGCPIRCLDEFDVFMDAVNRRISMKMMIESARTADRTQYILITPQDASSVSPGPDIRVHRLQDPERGQGILDVDS
ncbi:P-loop containing nucleoside triphosphate hydrolase protein [Rhizophagus clarus]|uniref:P-loop containing nucleoside triphosphate hydrolase protein n=1 Tax=Rhizophagus clarus TaxID=94130 RepID=A0A8H3LUB6_9GLOM|nr:P-loop containing nucleoside triphosphate hydrolase protein [Rhizophagus clarus]